MHIALFWEFPNSNVGLFMSSPDSALLLSSSPAILTKEHSTASETLIYSKEMSQPNYDNINNGSAFDMLPSELVSKIFWHLAPMYLIVAKGVCQQWRALLVGRHDSASTCYIAKLVFEGHLNIVQWAVKSLECPLWDLPPNLRNWIWNENTCAADAKGGHLEILQWLKSQGFPWDWQTCANAAEGGRLELLQWARSQGCPWNEMTCALAARRGHLKVLQMGAKPRLSLELHGV